MFTERHNLMISFSLYLTANSKLEKKINKKSMKTILLQSKFVSRNFSSGKGICSAAQTIREYSIMAEQAV
jgi:hypothetical protein